ncbi:MAG: hypothetical protein AAFV25_02715 [Bacteroidota bacterium]
MKIKYLPHYCLLALLLVAACTPKVATNATETPPEEETKDTPPVEEVSSKCKNWNQDPRREEIIESHVLYKDRLKEIRAEQKKGADANQTQIAALYDEAFALWKTAYEKAPGADGKRADHFEDGIRFYNYFYNKAAEGSPDRQDAVDNIMKLYDERAECYGEPGYIYGRKGFDYFYKYPSYATAEEKYSFFKQSIDIDGKKAQYFILNPFTALISNAVIEKTISVEEGREYQQKIREALAYGEANCETARECEPWKIVGEYVPARLEQLEGIKGFYDCNYFKNRYEAAFEADSTNCEIIDETLGRLRWGGCDENDDLLERVLAAKKANCKVVVVNGPLKSARMELEKANYPEAIRYYEIYVEGQEDVVKKANITLRIAKVYYVHLKQFSKARQYALKAAKLRSNWGEPYLLIGRLYASSGPRCGPGRGWDSQVVTWPAIDMWNKARSIDPEARAEANKFIRQYSKYMPSVEDIFQRGLKEGGTFKVGCWIQTNTVIRAAK